MSAARHAIRLLPWLLLAAGVASLWIALRHFDRLGLLDVYHLPEYRRMRVHPRSGFYLPCIAGLLSLITAAVLFLRAHNRQEDAGSGTIRLLNPDNRRP